MSLVSQLKSARQEGAATMSFAAMRRFVGYVAILLPIVVSAGYAIGGGHRSLTLDSISESYYTLMRDVFVGMLCMVGFFLIAYRGYNDMEDRLFNLCALLAFTIALFPMNPVPGAPVPSACTANPGAICGGEIELVKDAPFELFLSNRRLLIHEQWVGYVHIGSAATLFLLLGGISFYLFTLTDMDDATKPKRPKLHRNRLYRFCGVIIWFALGVYCVCCLLQKHLPSDARNFIENHLLYLVETVCLFAFGASWLVKGGGLHWIQDPLTTDTAAPDTRPAAA